MRKPLLQVLFTTAALATAFSANAQQCPGDEHFQKARGVIEDLQRIVTPDGIQDLYKTDIGGVPHWVNVRGEDRDNPLMLFVHGGPASPSMPGIWQFQRPIEEYFTVAHYDQRGAGKTYREADPGSIAGTLRIDTFVDDAIALAEHLRQRYGKDKLVLAAHSWGTVVAMKAALRRPDLFHAYVGIGQNIDSQANERLSFEYGLEQARKHGNAEAIAELESIAPYPGDQPITRERIILARKWPQHYGGLNAHRDAGQDYYYGASRLSPAYDCEDRKAFFEGNVFTLGKVFDEFLQVDFTGVREFPIPVVMFLGRHDYTTPSAPTAEWMARVDAPYKQVVWFENSAHMMPWEEPGKTLLSLLRYVRPLAVPADADTAAGTP